MVTKLDTALAAIIMDAYSKNLAVMNIPDEVLATLVVGLRKYFQAMVNELTAHLAQGEDGNE